jgi:hypothetical protein
MAEKYYWTDAIRPEKMAEYKASYLAWRDRNPDPKTTMRRGDPIYAEHPEFTDQRSWYWMRKNYGWEEEWVRTRLTGVETIRAEASPRAYLERLIAAERSAHDQMVMAQWDMDRHKTTNTENYEDARDNWKKALAVWEKAAASVQKQADVVRRQELEIDHQPKWEKLWKDTVAALKKEYVGKGPQYDLLIKSTADCAVRLERLRESERDLKSTEAYNWHTMLENSIKRLQTYTESTKVETTNKVINDIVNDLNHLYEGIIKPEQPILWQKCVRALRDHMSKRVA